MNISINEGTREADIWLTNAEKNNPCVADMLMHIYKSCSGSGYSVTLFVSGNAELNSSTADLVMHQLNTRVS